MDIHRYWIVADYKAQLVELLPGVTAAQLIRLQDLINTDRFLHADGTPHTCLINWVRAVLDRGGDAAPAVALPPPAPKPMPSGAEVIP